MPVIFLTGTSSVPIAVAAMRNGAVDFIEKPFDQISLIDRVNRTLARYDAPPGAAVDSDFNARMSSLTPREREVFKLMVTGATSKRMAQALGGSFRTIETHRRRVMGKMGAFSLADLVRMNITDGRRSFDPSS